MSRLRAPNQSSARRAAGLTLIELMVVVAVAAIILGLAAPSFSDYIVTQRLRSIHAQLATDLQFARSEAVARSAFVSVRFQEVAGAGGMTCYVIFTRPDPTSSTDTCDCTLGQGSACAAPPSGTPPITTEVRTVTIPAELKVSVRTPSGQTDTLTFDARSGALRFPASDSPTIVGSGFRAETSAVADSTRALRAVVSPAGRAELCTPAGSKLGGSPC